MTHPLFSPFQLRSVVFPNRIGVSPMCEYSSEDGFANDWHLVHLGCRAQGGAGLVMTEASAVTPEGRISINDLGIWKDEHIPKLAQIAQFIHAQGARAGVQLAHAGRKGSMTAPFGGERLLTPEEGRWEPLGPSPIAFSPTYAVPKPLDEAEISGVVRAFADAAKRVDKAGFDLVEIHAAHGYLLHEFLSPLANQRTDRYGGSFDNRIRLLLEVVDAVRAAWPDRLPVFVRISATDWADGGWSPDESVELAKRLREHGVDLVDVSSGGQVPSAKIPVGAGIPGAVCSADSQRSGNPNGCCGDDYPASASQRHRREWRGGHCAAGAGDAARSLLAPACGCGVGGNGELAGAVFARCTAGLGGANVD